MGKKKVLRLTSVLAVIVAMIFGIIAFVNADNSKSYVVKVVNAQDQADDASNNDDIKIQKSIKKQTGAVSYDEKELTYKVDVTNTAEKKNIEVAIIVDTSYSMESNDAESIMKTKVADLVNDIYTNRPTTTPLSQVGLRVYNAKERKQNRLNINNSTANRNTIRTSATNLFNNFGDGNDVATAISAATEELSATTYDNTYKYIILLTDATDNVKTEIQNARSSNIGVISILMNNVISNSYEENNSITSGKVQMVYDSTITDEESKLYEEFNTGIITRILNRSLTNVVVSDTFSDPLKRYFDFTPVTSLDSDHFEKTNDGYTWTTDEIKAGETKTLEYKLKIKDTINISDPSYIGHNLKVSDKVEVKYNVETLNPDRNDKDVTFRLEDEKVPLIMISEKYTVIIKAVNEEDYSTKIQGITFDVKVTDPSGNVLYNGTSTTDSNGEIQIDNIRTCENPDMGYETLRFDITPHVSIIGYDTTSSAEIDITSHYGTTLTVDTEEWNTDQRRSINNVRQEVRLNYPINTKKFNLDVKLTDVNNSNVLLSNVEFRLIQPQQSSKHEFIGLYGETESDGIARFTPSIMTKAGTYEYILSQLTEQPGYKSTGNVTIRITFDNNGNIVNQEKAVTTVYNETAEGKRLSNNHALVTLGNYAETEDMFNLELQLTDEDDPTQKLAGSEYTVEVTRPNSTSGSGTITTAVTNLKVQDDGRVLIDLPGSGNIQLRITQTKNKTGYNIDKEPKIITLYRANGSVQYISSAYNESTHNSLPDGSVKAFPSENKVIVKLTNKIKSERNYVTVKVIDTEETDYTLPGGIDFTLTNNITGQTYTAQSLTNGIATFQIDEQAAGNYSYTIHLANGLPTYYQALADTDIVLNFGASGYITNASYPVSTVSDAYWEDIEDGDFVNHTYNVVLGAEVDPANISYLELRLRDAESVGTGIEGAKYEITITSTTNGVTNVRNILRRTDSNGIIRTRIINGTSITVEVAELESATGYKIETSTKMFNLTVNASGVITGIDSNNKVNTELKAINNTNIKNYTFIAAKSGNDIICVHKNLKKTADDTLLDFTINKVYPDDSIASGVTVRIYQEDNDGAYVNTINGYTGADGTRYGTWLERGTILNDSGNINAGSPLSDSSRLNVKAKTDDKGCISLKGLKINGCSMTQQAVCYIYVVEVDSVTGADITSTLAKYKLTFGYADSADYNGIHLLSYDAFPDKLVPEKHIKGDSQELSVGYLGVVTSTIYTDLDNVGGLTLDLRKVDQDGNVLYGAKYSAYMLRTDGRNRDWPTFSITEDPQAEMSGLLVTEGTEIVLTEETPPIGYNTNKAETIKVTKVDEDTGEITIEADDNGYDPARIKVEFANFGITSDGSAKTEYVVTFTDYELDQFKMKIKAIDEDTHQPVAGYKFNIVSSKGAQKTTGATGANGCVTTSIGGYYDDTNSPITYNISTATNGAALYYKDFDAVTANVNFTNTKIVDTSTLTGQTDPNYGVSPTGTWTVTGINSTSQSDPYDIEIEVYVKQEDPLTVEIKTIDAVSESVLTSVNYTVTPSVGSRYNGVATLDTTNNVSVAKIGYVERNIPKDYTLTTTVPSGYEPVANQTFRLQYDANGDVVGIPSTNLNPKTTISIDAIDKKKVIIENYVEPRQGIQIVNKDYFTGQSLTGAKFEITSPSGDHNVADLTTAVKAAVLGDKNGEAGEEKIYKVHQLDRAHEHATLPDFEIKVIYGTNREVSDVQLVTTELSKWVALTPIIIPSTSSDIGYNGNDKGIVYIEVRSYPDFKVNVKNVDRQDATKAINGTQYSVSSALSSGTSVDIQTGTNGDGVGTAHFDELKINATEVIYTIDETSYVADYQKLEKKPIQIKVKFDADGYVDITDPNAVEIVGGYGSEYATPSVLTATGDNSEKFAVNLQITSNPKFRVNITNEDYNSGTLLSGAKYKISSEIGNSIAEDESRVTGSDGIGRVTLRVDGNTNSKTEVIYTIHEVNPATGYQSLEEDIKVKVTFNSDGTVNDYEVVQGDRFADKIPLVITGSTFDKFAIEIKIKNVELLKVNLRTTCTKTDNATRTDTIAVAGAVYTIKEIEVIPNAGTELDSKNGTTILDSTLNMGTKTLGINKTLSNKTVKLVVNEDSPAAGYKKLDSNIVIQVSFDETGKIVNTATDNPHIIDNDNGKNASAFAKVEYVGDYELNIDIRSNELLDFVISGTTKVQVKIESSDLPIIDDSGVTVSVAEGVKYIKDDIEYEIVKDDEGDLCKKFAIKTGSGFKYKISGKKINPSPEQDLNINPNGDADAVGSTNASGVTRISVDRALASTKIQYTITEVEKNVGYKWLVPKEMILEVEFDSNGNIIDKPTWLFSPNSDGVDANSIAQIVKVDVYENEIYIELVHEAIETFGIHLRAENMYGGASIDKVVANAYLTDPNSSTYASDGKYDYAVVNAGQTYTNNEYKYLYTGADRDGDGYADVASGEDYLTMRAYKEDSSKKNRWLRIVLRNVPEPYQWYAGNVGKRQEYAILIKLQFTDEGIVKSAQVQSGLNWTGIGDLADGRYVQVRSNGYGISVTLKFYPLLHVKMQQRDMYTESLIGGRLNLDTYSYPVGGGSFTENWYKDNYIQEGYIGNSSANGDRYNVKSSHTYRRAARTEAEGCNTNPSGTRVFYLYEEAEPGDYQRYRPKDQSYTYYNQTLIGKIVVKYNEDGTIKDSYVQENSWKSSNNIKKEYIIIPKWDGYYLDIDVLYAPTTKVQVKYIDSATKAPLGNIRVYPFNNGWSRYQYSTINYETTSAEGIAGWKYWGANKAGESPTTITIGTAFEDAYEYDGYFLPGNIDIDIGYASISDPTYAGGRISTATVTSNNSFGDKNARIDTSCYGTTTLKVIVELDRKFNLKIDKEDLYDSNIKLNANFNITAPEYNERKNNFSTKSKYITVGRVHAGKTVMYTLSEVGVLDGYLPLQNLNFYVDFNDNGTVARAYAQKGYEDFFRQKSLGPSDNGVKAPQTKDLTIGIKNEPALTVNVTVTDAFYSNLKLKDAGFTMENDRGDSASGSLETNADGQFKTTVGRVYKNARGTDAVEYIVKQIKTPDGYFDNNADMRFVVEYNENGKIESYYVSSGQEVMSIKPNIHNGTRKLNISIINVPKYVNIGFTKTDYNDGKGLNDVQFKVDVRDITTGNIDTRTYTTQTYEDKSGLVAEKVDDVETSSIPRVVEYTISEIVAPTTNGYRKMEDVVFNITYNEDGSIGYYEVISNPSDVGIKIYRKGTNITKMNGLPTAIRLDITNDDRYDIVIKDEDVNYPGLGVEGTEYQVSIDGTDYSPSATNNLGEARISKIQGTGPITINIAEKKVGSGYRDNSANNIQINLDKGDPIYSLDLNQALQVGWIDNKNATTANAIVNVDEEHGVITVTFKNETKLELDIGKSDKKTKKELEGVVFNIEAEEVDEYGNSKGLGVQQITTVDVDDITDSLGKLHFDLGTTPHSDPKQVRYIQYTITEVQGLEGYIEITQPIHITAKFDMYGQLDEVKSDYSLATISKNSKNKNGIIVLIRNEQMPEQEDEPINPEYSIKVQVVDSESNVPINDALVTVDARKADGTANIGHLQDAATHDVTANGFVIESGIVELEGLTQDGDIEIFVDQTQTVDGYEFSDKTSGTVKLHIDYVDNPTSIIRDIVFSDIYDDGFEVVTNTDTREIFIRIKNDPVMKLNINKFYEEYEEQNENGNKVVNKVTKPLEGARFTITSEIRTTTETIQSSLNKTTKSTDENGQVTVGIGKPYAGKTVIYTLKEQVPEGFEEIDDIILEVKYDASGNVKTDTKGNRVIEILSDEDITELSKDDKKNDGKTISIDVNNTLTSQRGSYKVILQKNSNEDYDYSTPIPGAEYDIKVTEAHGETYEWQDITDEKGQIVSKEFYGYGEIIVEYQEITAPDGYEKDDKIYYLKFNLDEHTGTRTQTDATGGFDLYMDYEGKEEVYVLPKDNLASEKYNLIINKIDSDGKRIQDNTIEFEISLIEQQTIKKLKVYDEDVVDEDGNIIYEAGEAMLDENGDVQYDESQVSLETILGTITTDETGKAFINAIDMPEEEGDYLLKIVEKKAPSGYSAKEEGYYINVTFKKNEEGEMEIFSIDEDEEDIQILKSTKQLVALNLINKSKTISDDIFELDITKIDSDTKEAILSNEPIFRLTDENGEVSYVETEGTTGKLKTSYFKLPAESDFADDTDSLIRTYRFEEIKEPKGYVLDNTPINVNITFKKVIKDVAEDDTENGEENNTVTDIIISKVEVIKGTDTLGKVIESTLDETGRKISFNIENEPQKDIDRGRYTINLTKIDGETKEPIKEHATFVITLENGEKVTASSDENGNMQVKDIKIPSTVVENPGPYSYIIEETKPAKGYELITGQTIMDVTFKALKDPITGELTGVYGIDNITTIPVITQQPDNPVASIADYDEEQVHVLIENTKLPAEVFEINIQKTDTDDVAIEESGIEFEFKEAEATEAEKYTTDENGKIQIQNIEMPTQAKSVTYSIKETKAPTGYQLDEEEILITIMFNEINGKMQIAKISKDQGENTTLKSATQNSLDISISNEKEKAEYSLKLKKVDEDENIINNTATFTIQIGDEDPQDYDTTNGEILLEHLDMPETPGHYTIRLEEAKAPDGYLGVSGVMELDVEVVVDENGKTKIDKVTPVNSPSISNIEVQADYIEFEVKNTLEEDKLFLTSEVYRPDTDKWIMSRVRAETTVTEFIDNLITNATTVTVYDKHGNALGPNDLVGTEMTVTGTRGSESITYIISVVGDLTGDGEIDFVDVSRLRMHEDGLIPLATIPGLEHNVEVYELAADIDDNGEIDFVDASKIRLHEDGLVRLY